MKLKFWNEQTSIYDEPINKVLNEMKTYGPDSPEFETQLTYLERLSGMKEKTKSIMRVSPDTVAIVAGNLVGILIIVAYEQAHPMTSKGLNYIKPQNH
jgi:hypothetical protein